MRLRRVLYSRNTENNLLSGSILLKGFGRIDAHQVS